MTRYTRCLPLYPVRRRRLVLFTAQRPLFYAARRVTGLAAGTAFAVTGALIQR